MNKFALSIFAVTAFLGLAACGSDDEKPQTTIVSAPAGVAPTKGQQLQDLKHAYDDGIISKDEYKDQKDKMLD